MIKVICFFLLISISGTLLHFTYKLSNKSIVVGIFSSVNESVWEHIKLLLTPIFFFNSIKYILGCRNNFFIALFVELLLSIILIIVLSNLKVKIFGDKYNYINIIIFYVTAFIVSLAGYVTENINVCNNVNIIFSIPCLVIFIMYLTFSVFPPKTKIFLDPITNTYGINKM